MDHLFANQQENIQNILTMQNTLSKYAQSFIDLQTQTFKNCVCNMYETNKNLLNSKNPQDVSNVYCNLFSPMQEIFDYNKKVVDFCTKMSQDVQEKSASFTDDCQKQMHDTIEAMTKNAPAGAEPFTSYLKSSMAAGAKIFEGINKASQQVCTMACSATKASVEKSMQDAEQHVSSMQAQTTNTAPPPNNSKKN